MVLNQDELDHLADVIAEVELKTCGEIRLMIVKRSSVASHLVLLLWSLLTALSLIVVWLWPQPEFAQIIFIPLLTFSTFVLAMVLSRWPLVERLLAHQADLIHQVWTRAEVEFHREGLSDTASHTGVLIFVSLFERRAVVLADKAIAEKVSEGAWDKVIAHVVDGARSGRYAEKLEMALRECGAYLAQHFPPLPGKSNELSNEVILKD